MHLCASQDITVRTAAFRFLCDNFTSNYRNYDPNKFADVAFIPAENNDGNRLERLGNVMGAYSFFCHHRS